MSSPVSESPALPLQAAIIDLLRDDAELDDLVTGVFDHVPEDQEHDYIVVGDHLSIPDNAHGQFGRETTETIHVWSKHRGNRDGQRIAARVGELLDHQRAALDGYLVGHRCVSIRQEFDQALRDPDPTIRHHIIRFRIQTEQEG